VEGDTEPFRVKREDGEPEVNRFADDWITLHLFFTLFWLVERHQSAFNFLKNGGMKWAEKVRHLTPEALATSARLAAGAGGIKGIIANKNMPQCVREALSAMQMALADVLGTDGHRRLCRLEGVAYMQLFGAPIAFCTPNIADNKQRLLLVVQGEEIRLDDTELEGVDLPRYRDMMRRLARDPVGQTRVFELIMRLFLIHVLGVRPDCVESRRRAKQQAPREWCTDGVAASSSTPGILGPVCAFRGEIEAQGRGSLHPHILVWLLALPSHELLHILKREPDLFKQRLSEWMRATVAAVQATCQSSVARLPCQFGDSARPLAPLPFSCAERSISRFDGGSELDELRAEVARGVELTAEQQQELDAADDDAWRRPCLQVRDAAGVEATPSAPVPPRESVYTKRLNEFEVAHCPAYRRMGTVRAARDSAESSSQHEIVGGLGADAWEEQFGRDVRRLATEILVHICGDSCFKYSGAKLTQICRHGFYYVVVVGDWQRRRRGKPLRNALFVVKQEKFGMQGRLLLWQEHPFERQSNYAALGALRCNFDMQDLRRFLPEEDWVDEELPHVGNQSDWGYMNTFEWDGTDWVARRVDSEGCAKPDLDAAPVRWASRISAVDWRAALQQCLASNSVAPVVDEHKDLCKRIESEINASFGDGLNTGFYINSYTTKLCPTMDGVLEEMRKGLERMQQSRDEARERYEADVRSRAAVAAEAGAEGSTCGATEKPAIAQPKKLLSLRTCRS